MIEHAVSVDFSVFADLEMASFASFRTDHGLMGCYRVNCHVRLFMEITKELERGYLTTSTSHDFLSGPLVVYSVGIRMTRPWISRCSSADELAKQRSRQALIGEDILPFSKAQACHSNRGHSHRARLSRQINESEGQNRLRVLICYQMRPRDEVRILDR